MFKHDTAPTAAHVWMEKEVIALAQNNATAQPCGGPAYEIRKAGVVCVQSSLPGCGYTAQELRDLRAAGFDLYEDGKKVKGRR